MLRKVTHRIAVGFTILVVFILVVGAGGLWGNANINHRLHQLTERSFPLYRASFQKLASLQQANIAMLEVLASYEPDPSSRNIAKQRFNQQMSLFEKEHQQLGPLLQGDEELLKLAGATAEAQSAFEKQAQALMQAHEALLEQKNLSHKQNTLFLRQVDSMLTWGQRYISRFPVAGAEAREMLRTVNRHKNQIATFNQTQDIARLNEELESTAGELEKDIAALVAKDTSAKAVKALGGQIIGQLYGEQGVAAAYRTLSSLGEKHKNQMLSVQRLLDQVRNQAESFSRLTQEQTVQIEQKVDKETATSRYLIIALLLGAIIIAVFISLISVRAISKPLNAMLGKLAKVAQGDMRVNFEKDGQDEFGQLSASLSEVMVKLRSLLAEIGNVSSSLNQVAKQNADTSQHTNQAMAEQSVQLDTTASSATEMEATVAEVSSHAGTTLQAVYECEKLSADADRHMQQTVSSIELQAQEVNRAVEQGDQLSQYSQQISSISDTIGTIAGQTNLLALNAAIEAARAGDSGRGFAVVADEVRALAGRAQNATNEIQDMVTNMQRSIQQVVDVMHQSVSQSHDCVEHASTSQTSLQAMNQTIANIREMSTHITEAASQQQTAVEEVSRTLVAINQAAANTTEGAQTVTATSEELLQIAREQQRLIAQFKT